jgi:hypothetical protein
MGENGSSRLSVPPYTILHLLAFGTVVVARGLPPYLQYLPIASVAFHKTDNREENMDIFS